MKTEKNQQKKTLKRVLRALRPYGWEFALSLLLAAATVVFTLYGPVLIGEAVDCIVAPGRVNFQGLLPILWNIGAVALLTALSQWLMSLVHQKLTYDMVRDLREKAFAKLQRVPMEYVDGRQRGDVISRITTDVDQLSDGLLMGFSQLFTGVITILGTLGFMVALNPWVALAVVLITPVSLVVATQIAKRTYHMFARQSEARGEMTALVEEMIGNAKVVRAFGYEDDAQKRMEVLNQTVREYGQKATFFSSLTNPCTRFVNGLVYAAVGIVGAFATVGGLISVGQLSCLLTYANQYTKPFNEISGVITELQNAFASAARVFDLIDAEAEPAEPVDAQFLTHADGRVALEGVFFSYHPEKPLIENLNLSVDSGQRIAIVGPTGCGKTTIINLLMRFYDPQKGEIRVSGIPVGALTRESLRESYGMVLQESWIKTATVWENIAYGNPKATWEEIEAAAKAAFAHGFIRRLPKGYDTVISDDSDILSPGQKQLLCIARVILSLPQMLILDEATSSIDTRTEIRIQKALSQMMEGRTSFIVAHRLSTIREADVILVMRDGHIVEQGNHAQLLQRDGFYAELYYSQFDTEE